MVTRWFSTTIDNRADSLFAISLRDGIELATPPPPPGRTQSTGFKLQGAKGSSQWTRAGGGGYIPTRHDSYTGFIDALIPSDADGDFVRGRAAAAFAAAGHYIHEMRNK